LVSFRARIPATLLAQSAVGRLHGAMLSLTRYVCAAVKSKRGWGVLQRTGVRGNSGVTLIELLITITVLAVIITMAVPSFRDLNERRSLKGVADGIVGVIGVAKEEAIKRDAFIRVQFSNMGGAVCAGANLESEAACDCSVAGSCSIASFPSAAGELKMVTTRTAPAFTGSGSAFSIDPKTGMLSDPANIGSLELQTPLGYAMQVSVNAMVRPRVCSSGSKPVSGVRTCAN
jgi:type IV fimbrial biogenesis protein FimT